MNPVKRDSGHAGSIVEKYLWQRISTKYVLHNEFESFLDHKLVNKCKSVGNRRLISIAHALCREFILLHMFIKFVVWVYTIKALLVSCIFVCFSLIYDENMKQNT